MGDMAKKKKSMVVIEFLDIWSTKVSANGPWNYTASIPETSVLYRDKLSKFSKEVFSEAVDRLLTDEPDRLPGVGIFARYCQWVQEDMGVVKRVNECPCCRGTCWIYLKDKNAVTPCDCNGGFPPEKRISSIFHDDKKCETGECSPDGEAFNNQKRYKLAMCPKGRGQD